MKGLGGQGYGPNEEGAGRLGVIGRVRDQKSVCEWERESLEYSHQSLGIDIKVPIFDGFLED